MTSRNAVDVFHATVDGSQPHEHLMAVGTSTCVDGEAVANAITVRNVSQTGEVCVFHGVKLDVHRAACPVCGEPVLATKPSFFEEILPEGEVGVNYPPDDPPPPC
jgi:hypothetical protein